ncbi:MAG: transketolase [Nanoarchaeota archaeon]|nr:transketolase [Nanoarchaeota archaeon]MBU1004355.1 transketolase [Nanoarchaeota archaeon]MBU1946544.1 transketolase [Nanoarchaeota archaeon]
MEQKLIEKLEKQALQIRMDVLEMITEAKSGHPGGSLSAVDIMTVLYFHKMRYNPKKPKWEDRDRFVLSKGHACPALYACLARSGYFPLAKLKTLRKIGSCLQGHPESNKCSGIEASTGPLGQGLSFANGVGLAGKLDKKDYKVYVMLGDGEVQEGNIWEAAMLAAHYKLNNVIVFLDHNRLQIDGELKDVMNIEPIKDKFSAFGWHTIEINGHDFKEILNALDEADKVKDKPIMIIANTIKSKGVDYMENKAEWHGKAPTQDQLKEALAELV